jgi:hypothetical protein
VGPRAGLDAMVKRKISSTCRESNTRSSSPQASAVPLSRINLHSLSLSLNVTGTEYCRVCYVSSIMR